MAALFRRLFLALDAADTWRERDADETTELAVENDDMADENEQTDEASSSAGIGVFLAVIGRLPAPAPATHRPLIFCSCFSPVIMVDPSDASYSLAATSEHPRRSVERLRNDICVIDVIAISFGVPLCHADR